MIWQSKNKNFNKKNKIAFFFADFFYYVCKVKFKQPNIMTEFFYYLLAWLALGFNAGVIFLLIAYLKKETIDRKQRNHLFKRCLYFGAFSFVVFFIYLFVTILNYSKK